MKIVAWIIKNELSEIKKKPTFGPGANIWQLWGNWLSPSSIDMLSFDEFFLIFVECHIKRVFQQNNLINALIWRIFYEYSENENLDSKNITRILISIYQMT